MLHLYAAEIQASKIIPRKYISNIWIVGDVAAPNGLIFWEKTLVIAHYKWIEVWHWESEAQSIFYVSQAWSVWTLTSESWKNWDIVLVMRLLYKTIPSSLLKWMLGFVATYTRSHLPSKESALHFTIFCDCDVPGIKGGAWWSHQKYHEAYRYPIFPSSPTHTGSRNPARYEIGTVKTHELSKASKGNSLFHAVERKW